ncbi:hypothetical protein Nhal_0391 [Nitrosococcus halophilus Nc 4]|uniref:Uncharacterized protein n=1 Tax=Nitrosococcus halophilus (strain Nc4) TaxID=472759 RepID=D5BVF3_NITHN|nr:hypothetical protein [Nitrosococcus halophilus]ADE13581.1 hypothetical protein Nhal_0391 [Nitrosococcus halophilus Nc 4]
MMSETIYGTGSEQVLQSIFSTAREREELKEASRLRALLQFPTYPGIDYTADYSGILSRKLNEIVGLQEIPPYLALYATISV